MRVPHLTDLLTWEEIWTRQDAYRSGQGGTIGWEGSSHRRWQAWRIQW